MNTLGLVNVLNNDGNVLIDVAQMADSHIQNATIHNALSEWNETDDPQRPGYAEAVEKNYSKLANLIGEDRIDSIRDFHEGVETGKYFPDMEFDLKDPEPSAKYILECLGSLEKPVQKAMDNFERENTFHHLAEKNLLREATLFTSGVLEEKNGRLIVPQGYRPGIRVIRGFGYERWVLPGRSSPLFLRPTRNAKD